MQSLFKHPTILLLPELYTRGNILWWLFNNSSTHLSVELQYINEHSLWCGIKKNCQCLRTEWQQMIGSHVRLLDKWQSDFWIKPNIGTAVSLYQLSDFIHDDLFARPGYIGHQGSVSYKDCLFGYVGFHYIDKMVLRPSYLYDGDLYFGKMASLY